MAPIRLVFGLRLQVHGADALWLFGGTCSALAMTSALGTRSFLFNACMIVAHALSFPGVFSPTGLMALESYPHVSVISHHLGCCRPLVALPDIKGARMRKLHAVWGALVLGACALNALPPPNSVQSRFDPQVNATRVMVSDLQPVSAVELVDPDGGRYPP